jgi:hypothetical protein
MAKRNKQSHMMPVYLDRVSQMVGKAWAVPAPHGQSLASSLCDVLRHNGGLDVLINNCVADDSNLQLSSARLLEQCLTQENREYVVECGLDKVNRHFSLSLSPVNFCIDDSSLALSFGLALRLHPDFLLLMFFLFL